MTRRTAGVVVGVAALGVLVAACGPSAEEREIESLIAEIETIEAERIAAMEA